MNAEQKSRNVRNGKNVCFAIGSPRFRFFWPSRPLRPSVSFCNFGSFSLCPEIQQSAPGKIIRDNPSTTLTSWKLIQQAERNVEKLHVAEEFRFVDGMDFLHGFQFQQQAAVDQDVEF